jgi:hypothetical protein
MSLLLTAKLDQFSEDGDIDGDAATDVIFTMVEGWAWGETYNLVKLSLPTGGARHITYLDSRQVDAAINALNQAETVLEASARLDLFNLSKGIVTDVGGTAYDVTFTLDQLPKREADVGVTERAAIALVKMHVPIAGGGAIDCIISMQQLRTGITILLGSLNI